MTDRRHLGELVAVVIMSDNGNEDHWAQASWHATVAAVKAAVSSGYDESELTLSWAGHSTRVATAGDGRGFAAIVRGVPGGPLYGVAQPPDQDDLDAWAGKCRPPSKPSEPHPRWSLLWQRLEEHQGETFHTMRGVTFTYALNVTVVNHVLFQPVGRHVHRADICHAVEEWPVSGPGGFQPRIGQPRYVYGLVSDERIRRGDW